MLLVLASGSPRRREILSLLGIAFEVQSADVDETPFEGERALDLAVRVARAKCERASASASGRLASQASRGWGPGAQREERSDETEGSGAPQPIHSVRGEGRPAPREEHSASAYLSADTVVDVDGVPLGKPVDDLDALRMLHILSGRAHLVHTAIALGVRGEITVRSVTTEVVFRALSQGEVARYVAAGECRDKAGAYALQGLGAGLVTEVRGSPSNVIGLPAAETIALLLDRGVIDRWPA